MNTQREQAPMVERDMGTYGRDELNEIIPTALERIGSTFGYEMEPFKLVRTFGIGEDSPSDEFLADRAAREEEIFQFEQKQDLFYQEKEAFRREQEIYKKEKELFRLEQEMLHEEDERIWQKQRDAEATEREEWLELERQAALYNPAAGAENSEDVIMAFDIVGEKKLKEQWAFMVAKYKAMGITL